MIERSATRRVVGRAIKIAASVLAGGLFYAVWLAVSLLTADFDSSVAGIIRWASAPVVTAAGFALGVVIHERLTEGSGAKFLRVYAWSLTGCAVGAVSVYWYGPMLIVFGMFVVGTASIVLREIVLCVQSRKR